MKAPRENAPRRQSDQSELISFTPVPPTSTFAPVPPKSTPVLAPLSSPTEDPTRRDSGRGGEENRRGGRALLSNLDNLCPDVAPYLSTELPKIWAVFVDGRDTGVRVKTRKVVIEGGESKVASERVVDGGDLDESLLSIMRAIFDRDYACHDRVLYVVGDGGMDPYLLNYDMLLAVGSTGDCSYTGIPTLETRLRTRPVFQDAVKVSCDDRVVALYYAKHLGLVRVDVGSISLVFERYE